MSGRKETTGTVYQLKITLKETKPPIWRRIQVSDSITLYRLHRIIQEAMGWWNYHLYEFELGRDHYGEPDPDWGAEIKSARRIRLNQLDLREGTKFSYVYDMGDYWVHEILVEKFLLAEEGKRYPTCIMGRRACPPEDCGGTWGYAELLEVLKDPNHEDHLDRLDWLGGQFDPDAFGVDEINRKLARIR
jgi:hypothetical protein